MMLWYAEPVRLANVGDWIADIKDEVRVKFRAV